MSGAEYNLYRLAQALQHRFTIAIAAPGGGPFEAAAQQLDVEYWPFDAVHPVRRVGEVLPVAARSIPTVRDNVERLAGQIERPDLVHSNTFLPWEGAMLAAAWDCPHVWNLHESLSQSRSWSPLISFRSQLSIMNRLTDRFVSVSSAVDATLVGVPVKKRRVVNNGLDAADLLERTEARAFLAQRCGIASDATVLLTAAHFSRDKAYDFLCPVVERVLASGLTNVVFLWVGGDDGELSDIRQRLAAFTGAVQVLTPGPIEGVARYMAGADVYLLPSATEGFPTTVLEAFLARLPVIARDCGGVRDMAACGGLVITEFGSSDAMATRLLEHLDGSRPIEAPRHHPFTVERMANGYSDVYEEVMASYRSSRSRKDLAESLRLLADDLAPCQVLVREGPQRPLLAAREKELVDARSLLDARNTELTALRPLLEAREEELSNIQALSAAREEELSNIQALSAARAVELSNIQALLAAREEELRNLRPLLAVREDELSNLHPLLAARDEELAALHGLLEAREVEIANLRAALSEHATDHPEDSAL